MLNQVISTAPDQYQSMLENYASIVEKTNNQLSLGIGLSTLMVTILAAFIAAIAIVVAWYIWKNSREQKELFKNTISEVKNTLNAQTNLFIEQKKSEVDKTIADFEKLKISTTKEKEKELQKIIDQYKKEKEEIGRGEILTMNSPNKIFWDPKSVSGSNSSVFGGISSTSQNSILAGGTKGFFSNSCTRCGSYISDFGANYCSNCGSKL